MRLSLFDCVMHNSIKMFWLRTVAKVMKNRSGRNQRISTPVPG
jgi:hypothetical protein